jgi:hypothetical protein
VEWGNETADQIKIKIEIEDGEIYLVNFAIMNQSGASPEAFRPLR